jgi:hypothetical protein
MDDRLLVACGLSWAAGVIHVQATAWHLDEHLLYAAVFALLAAAQFAWGIVIYRRPSRGLVWAGAASSVVVVAIWLVSRTTGLPIGPEQWSPEPVGAADAIATADELLLALMAVSYLRPRPSLFLGRATRTLATAAGLALISLSSLTFMFSGQAH